MVLGWEIVGWFGDGLGVVGGGLGLVWGSGLDGEIRVTIRAGLLSHWPVDCSLDEEMANCEA